MNIMLTSTFFDTLDYRKKRDYIDFFISDQEHRTRIVIIRSHKNGRKKIP
jgi:hypothetical protein